VRLSVGGEVFQTARSTLSASAYFKSLLSEDYTDLDAQTGEVFVDRDPRYFHYILQYLRSGRMEHPAPPLTPHGLLDEAEYFAVEGLVQALKKELEPPGSLLSELRADGTGMYVWDDKLNPGHSEALCFELDAGDMPAVVAFVAGEAVLEAPRSPHARSRASRVSSGADGHVPLAAPEFTRGTLQYSRGPCARENLIALQAMPKPLPSIWRESGDASTIVAHFTQRFLSRGTFKVEGTTLVMSRGNLSEDAAVQPGTHPVSTVATVGLIMSSDELLLLEPTTDAAADPTGLPSGTNLARSALEQLGLGNTSSRALGGLGGGFKRFVFEEMPQGAVDDPLL